MVRAYEEIIDFLAAGTSPHSLIDFRPSDAAKLRLGDLIEREKEGTLTVDETSELLHYLQIEHLMRLAKARARAYIGDE
jgi:hypothetical protein